MKQRKHVMFDIDGTLVQSFEFDEQVFVEAVFEISGLDIDQNWASYPHVTDWGLIRSFCEKQASVNEFAAWYPAIKACFIDKISDYVKHYPVQPIPGAIAFFETLSADERYQVSIATGGWLETAKLKLKSAGFNINDTQVYSSNDHYEREQIMALAATSKKMNYFGDASWDKKACQRLGYNFIGVGPRVQHAQHIENYLDPNRALNFIC